MRIVEIRQESDATLPPLHLFHVSDPDSCVNSFALRFLLLANKITRLWGGLGPLT